MTPEELLESPESAAAVGQQEVPLRGCALALRPHGHEPGAKRLPYNSRHAGLTAPRLVYAALSYELLVYAALSD